ncbi:hypothetical protein DN824_20480 [Stutzerimonas nosocomialis]|uniref:hypothetical protein n=1 Tax=Stutzerimonas nosocomialis TaxID=1056496 RepID=UPI0011098214|nr:hypothetical protein [Stutzerimonas nosocomialis]TLX54862.1 hypothetical protein DN824_20480 [Stutzerimonas nosocomialis]
MATLAEQRRNSGAAMEKSRRDSGDAMAKSRRDSGAAMETNRRGSGADNEASRRGQSVAEDLHRLANPPTQRKPLPRVPPVGALPATVGVGNYVPPPAAGNGGGIASPLTEQTRLEAGVPVPDRDYWPNQIMTSSDGLRVWEVRPIRTWRFTDAEGNPVVFNIAQPKQDFA